MDLSGFNAEEHKSSSFDPLPVGDYLAVITDSEQKKTNAGNGHYLKLTFEITQGDYKGRKLWTNLNLDNPNPEAVRIAQGELSAICKAVGILKPADSVDLHNIPLMVKVGLTTNKQTGDAENRIKGYKSRPGVGEAAAGAIMPNKAPAASASSTAPWARK